MTEFSKIWDTEVKDLAQSCITEPEYVRLMLNVENKLPTKEDHIYLQSLRSKYKDLYGMICISDMIWKVDHALADRRLQQALMAIIPVYNCLSSYSYFENVFQSDSSSEEWKTREALKNGLERLIKL